MRTRILGVLLLAAAAAALPERVQAQERKPAVRDSSRVLERLRAGRRGVLTDTTAAPASAATDTPRAARAAPPPNPQFDSIAGVLRALEGYETTDYLGTAVRFRGDTIELAGKAQVTRAGQTITADSLLAFELETEVVCGYGNPVVTGGGTGAPVASEQVCYDIRRQVGIARAARTQFSQMATWYVHGDTVYTVGSDRIYAHDAKFTDCELEVPHYHFSAEQVKIVNEDVLVARDVTLNFRDVPVFWLPFMMQSMKQGRRSGLLTPNFGVNDIARTSEGYRRRISNLGFFWAIDEHLGSEVAVDWFSGNYVGLAGSFDYRYLRQFLEGRATFRRFWMDGGGTEFTLATNHRWSPGERTNVVADARYTSSGDFVRRQTFNPLELNRSIDSNASISHRFDWGSMSLGAQRRQYITDDKVELRLPSLSLSLQPITLFSSTAAQPAWYNNATWTASGSFSLSGTDVQETRAGAAIRDQDLRTGSATSQLNLGNLAFSQQIGLNETIRHLKPAVEQDTALPRTEDERIEWSTSLNYQQRLIGTSTFTPGVTLRGGTRRATELGGIAVSAPAKLDLNATLRTDLFGFWPGFGPYTRLRHRMSPSVTYSYSPEVKADSLQRLAFTGSAVDVREQNRVTISLSQTFEAKHAASDSVQNEAEQPGEQTAGEPRRLPQERKTTLLSINTDAVIYDFVRAREDTLGNIVPGLQTTQLGNSITSDLLRGLSLSFTHDLFAGERIGETGAERRARFSPHLSRVNANFSLGSDSWILRVLGLGGGSKVGESLPQADTSDSRAAEFAQTPSLPAGDDFGMIGRQRQSSGPLRGGNIGRWDAQFRYTLVRPRESDAPAAGAVPGSIFGQVDNQMLHGSLRMQPTQNWSVSWTTAYSLSAGEFADHMLTLSRDLHEWQANFHFLKAQNGNFSFEFRVQLRSAPDLKVEYEQRGRPTTE